MPIGSKFLSLEPVSFKSTKRVAIRKCPAAAGHELDQAEGGRLGVLAVHVEAALLTLVGVVFMQLEGFERLPPALSSSNCMERSPQGRSKQRTWNSRIRPPP
jgi:hypothetical protein